MFDASHIAEKILHLDTMSLRVESILYLPWAATFP